jgi:tellurite methyltransferase
MTNVVEPAATLREEFGEIDIYLFDQLNRGRLTRDMRVLDAGCGHGRNLVYLLRAGFDVRGVDVDAAGVEATRRLAQRLRPDLDVDRFRAEPVERMSFPDGCVDYVISSAVLHFARDAAHWRAMVDEMWRVLAPSGVLFARLASRDGQEGKLQPAADGRYVMPDGVERFLIDEAELRTCTEELGGTWMDPLKTSIVHGARSMATWIIRKSSKGVP